MIYVVGGQGAPGLLADVWASDTAGRSWARMCPRAPFGPRTGVACATVPGNPLVLVVAGGVSDDVHRDLWVTGHFFGGESAKKLLVDSEDDYNKISKCSLRHDHTESHGCLRFGWSQKLMFCSLGVCFGAGSTKKCPSSWLLEH